MRRYIPIGYRPRAYWMTVHAKRIVPCVWMRVKNWNWDCGNPSFCLLFWTEGRGLWFEMRMGTCTLTHSTCLLYLLQRASMEVALRWMFFHFFSLLLSNSSFHSLVDFSTIFIALLQVQSWMLLLSFLPISFFFVFPSLLQSCRYPGQARLNGLIKQNASDAGQYGLTRIGCRLRIANPF